MDDSKTKKRVLLVDDNISARNMLRDLFHTYTNSISVLESSNGIQALELLDENDVDLIITDEVMPRMSGVTFFSKAREKGITCPFIIITGLKAREVDLPHSLSDNNKGPVVVEKPFKINELLKTVSELLGYKEAIKVVVG